MTVQGFRQQHVDEAGRTALQLQGIYFGVIASVYYSIVEYRSVLIQQVTPQMQRHFYIRTTTPVKLTTKLS